MKNKMARILFFFFLCVSIFAQQVKFSAETRRYIIHQAPILALTARTMKYDEDQAREAGCTAYATKPFRIADLRAKIAELLDG